MPWRIVHVTTVHDISTDTRIVWREAASQAAQGHDVHVVAQDWDAFTAPPGITFHPLSHPRGRLDRFLRLGPQATRLALDLEPDFIHVHDPELMPYMWPLRRRTRRIIYDAHEDLPRQMLMKPYLGTSSRKLASTAATQFVRTNDRLVDGVVCATPKIAAGFSRAPTAVVQNFPVISAPSPLAGAKPLEAIYVGTVTRPRGAIEMVEALEIFEMGEVVLTMVGPTHDPILLGELQGLQAWNRVDYVGPTDPARARHLMHEAKVGLCLMHPTQAYLDAYPTKLFEYLAEGIPVIASDFPLWRKILGGADCAYFVDPLDSQRIGAALGALLSDPQRAMDMGQRGKELVLEQFSWQSQFEHLESLYDGVMGSR